MPGPANGRSMLTLFALTAIATIAGHWLPSGSAFRPVALLLDAVPLAGVVAATALAFRRLASLADSRACLFVALSATFAGGLIGALGVAHTSAVALVAIERASRLPFVFTFRLYSLVLFGALLIVLGLMAAIEAGRLSQGHRAGWRRSLFVWTAILAINLPLVPLQGFALLFSGLAAFELLLLATTLRHFIVKPGDA
ncbi:MAG: hypothetical protein M3P06_20245 [Acidobacteriota bacterium]|nr:hypothetical protein [Acidobacteriota bacterium]